MVGGRCRGVCVVVLFSPCCLVLLLFSCCVVAAVRGQHGRQEFFVRRSCRCGGVMVLFLPGCLALLVLSLLLFSGCFVVAVPGQHGRQEVFVFGVCRCGCVVGLLLPFCLVLMLCVLAVSSRPPVGSMAVQFCDWGSCRCDFVVVFFLLVVLPRCFWLPPGKRRPTPSIWRFEKQNKKQNGLLSVLPFGFVRSAQFVRHTCSVGTVRSQRNCRFGEKPKVGKSRKK